MKISVITPTIRPQFLEITAKSLERQSFQDFEWLVEINFPSHGFSLSKDFNKLLWRANGEIIVILQDCINVPNTDALKNIAALDFDKKAYTFPVGKIAKQGDQEGINWDWRKFRETAIGKSEITANQWEIDFGAASRQMFLDIGGFDEEYDQGWSWENVDAGWRAEAAGYRFICSQAADGVAIDHDKLMEHPFRNKRPNNDKRANETMEKARRGDFRLRYLN